MRYVFKVSLAFYGSSFFLGNFPYMEKIMQKYLLQIFHHCFICIATVKLLHFLRSFQINLRNTFYSNAFYESIKLDVRIVVPKRQSLILRVLREMFCWYIVLYPMSQFLHQMPKRSELPYC